MESYNDHVVLWLTDSAGDSHSKLPRIARQMYEETVRWVFLYERRNQESNDSPLSVQFPDNLVTVASF